MLADEMWGMTASSAPMRQAPNDSPMSQLMSMARRRLTVKNAERNDAATRCQLGSDPTSSSVVSNWGLTPRAPPAARGVAKWGLTPIAATKPKL